MDKKYICHVIGTGFVVTLIILTQNCPPLGIEDLTIEIVQQKYNPACYVASFNLELPEFPQNQNPITGIKVDTITASGTANASLSNIPSPSAEIPEA